MFQFLCLFLSFSGFVSVNLVFGQECSLTFDPDQRTMLVLKGNDISILCNASCYGRQSANQFAWFDRHNDRVPPVGRVFSVSYNQGMYVRLIIQNADLQDMGRYACVGLIGEAVVSRGINVNVIDPDAHVVEFVEEEGPRRGDVRVDVPFLPNRRPVRDVQNRDVIQRVRREAGSTESNPTKSTEMEAGTTELKPTKPTETITDKDSTGRDRRDAGTTESSPTKTTDTMKDETSTSQKGPADTNLTSNFPNDIDMSTGSGDEITGSPGNETSESTTLADSRNDTSPGGVGPGTRTGTPFDSGNSSEVAYTSKTAPATTTKARFVTSKNGNDDDDDDEPENPSTPASTTPSTTKAGCIPKTGSDGGDESETTDKCPLVHGGEARTAFGRYGVLAFALALSAAILLLYTLILLNVILPRCCWKKRSVNFRDEGAIKHKETGPNAVDFVALKPLDVESGPNSPDHGFTTVDLDDNPANRPDENKHDDKQNGAPVSPSSSSEPQSPSKYVTTFTIGRKPSTTDPSGVFIHEGKQGDTISALPEEGAAADQKPTQATEDRPISGSVSAKKDTENDMDTSKEADTSSDSNTDSSGS